MYKTYIPNEIFGIIYSYCTAFDKIKLMGVVNGDFYLLLYLEQIVIEHNNCKQMKIMKRKFMDFRSEISKYTGPLYKMERQARYLSEELKSFVIDTQYNICLGCGYNCMKPNNYCSRRDCKNKKIRGISEKKLTMRDVIKLLTCED